MRKTLIINIESFLQESLKLYNVEEIIRKSEYFELESKISCLSKSDFDSEEKFQYFLTYYNQPRRGAEKYLFEKELKQDKVNSDGFLWMQEYLTRIKEWIK